MKTTLFFSALFLLSIGVSGQTKSQIKELNIKSSTIIVYDYSTGKENKKKESFEKFNASGQVVESIDYDKAGKQKERIEFTYNENKNCIQEKCYDSSNNLEKIYKYTYENDMLKSKEKYDSKNTLIWRKLYIYEI
jgi:hypothetical protein